MKNFLLSLLLLSSPILFSQSSSIFNNSRNWILNKQEIYFAVGTTHFLGDLGGKDKIGTQKSLVDLDFPNTRVGGGIGYRLRFHPRWATSTQFYFGIVSGDDANTQEIIRNSRNLSFRSPIIELSQRIEFIILANEQSGGRRGNAEVLYVFTGASGFFFNPQTKINGAWTNLKDLKTEGQGLPGGAEEYSNISASIPFGIGFKFAVSKTWRLGVEFSYNKTFTDYIDDVSTNYFDPAVLAQEVGGDAVYAANPSIDNESWFTEGQQRGNSNDKDAYLFGNITITKNISNGRGSSRSRRGGRTKF